VPDDQPPTAPTGLPELIAMRAELAADVRRVSERLRSLSATRLAAPPAPSPGGRPDHPSRAAAGRAAAQQRADAAAALEAAAAGTQPERRALPVLPDLAVGDQVAVTGHDLLAALDLLGRSVDLSTDLSTDRSTAVLPAGRPFPAEQAVRDACRALADVRRRL
jgi:hypothetical protein